MAGKLLAGKKGRGEGNLSPAFSISALELAGIP